MGRHARACTLPLDVGGSRGAPQSFPLTARPAVAAARRVPIAVTLPYTDLFLVRLYARLPSFLRPLSFLCILDTLP